jgi:hypothetical protein
MNMTRLPVFCVLIALLGCDLNPGARIPVAAAQIATQQYAKQDLRADAAGDDCKVLLIRTKKEFDNALVESIHYGIGDSDTYQSGMQQFAEAKGFRAVVYRDAAGDLWTYGSITLDEAKSMPTCR